MSELLFGEFSIDPETIPNPPRVQEGVPLVFEIATSVRGEITKEDTGHTAWVDLEVRPVEQPEARLYPRLFITERFTGAAHKSWKNFLLTIGLDPKTARAQDVVRLRFKGIAGKDRKRDDDRPVLVKVLGSAE